jgi:hypothetical protein
MLRERPQRVDRPLSVTVIAIYQFLRAGALLLVLMSLWWDAGDSMGSHAGFGLIVFLVTQRISILHYSQLSSMLVIVFLLTIYFAATGIGLLILNKWARRATIAMSGIGIIRLMFVVGMLAHQHSATLTMAQQMVLSAFLFLDCVVISSLINHAQAFGAEG